MSESAALAWTFRGISGLMVVIFILQHNWGGLCWVVVAEIQHERAEFRR